MEPLFHITTRAAWDAARAAGAHRPPSLATEGFVHLSTERQWRYTLQRFFRGEPELVVLRVDPARVGCELRYERADGDEFPHLYGALAVDAVVGIRPAPRTLGLAPDLAARVLAADDAIAEVHACEVLCREVLAPYGVLAPHPGREGQISIASVIAELGNDLHLGWLQVHSLPRLPGGALDEAALLAYVEGVLASA